MHRRIRGGGLAMLALIAVLATSGGVAAGEDDAEPVVWELTLSGDVDSDDSFGIFHQCETRLECVFIHDVDVACSSDEQFTTDWGVDTCEARTYRVAQERAAGDVIDYAIALWDDEFNVPRELLLRDSVTVPEGGFTLRLEYDYSRGGSAPAAPVSPPTLPDTGARPPGSLVAIGVVLIAMALVISRAWIPRGVGGP